MGAACCSGAPPRRSSSSSNWLLEFARLGAAGVFVVGFILTAHFVVSTSESSFDHIADMIDVDSGTKNTRSLMMSMIISCFVMLCTGVIGIAGVQLEAKGPVCVYFVLASLLTLYFVWAFAYGIIVSTSVGPILLRQEQEFCDGATHEVYYGALGCNYSNDAGAPMIYSPCNADCQSRTDMLVSMGGCGFLKSLCSRAEYEYVDEGACSAGGAPGTPTSAVMSSSGPAGSGLSSPGVATASCCQKACDSVLACSGFAYARSVGVCNLFSDRAPPHMAGSAPLEPPSRATLKRGRCPEYAWRPMDPGSVEVLNKEAGIMCFSKKPRKELMDKVANIDVWLIVGSLLAVVFLSIASVTSCLLQYTLTTNRQGKKGAVMVLYKMLCPCLQPKKRKQGFARVRLSSTNGNDSDSSEESHELQGKD